MDKQRIYVSWLGVLLILALAFPAIAADKAGLAVSWLGVFASGWAPTKAGYEGGCITNGDFDRERFRAFIHQARREGANSIRIFPYEAKWVTAREKMFSPVLWNAERGAWDLDAWNGKYFAALDDLIEICELNHIQVWFSLFDNCQHHAYRLKAMTPWQNNIQGLENYFASTEQAKKWVNKIASLYGNRLKYEIGNELCVRPGTPPLAAGTWLAQMADAVLRSGVPPENICWGAEPIGTYADGKFTIDKDRDLTVLASRALSRMVNPLTGKIYNEDGDRAQDRIYCTIHNVGVLDPDPKDERIAVQLWGGSHTRKAILSDDGQSAGHSAMNCEQDGTWRRGNYAETFEAQRYLSANDGGKPFKWIFESLPSNTAPPAWLDNIKAMAAAYHQRFGIWPENRGTPDPVYTSPAPEPEPEPEPIPDPEAVKVGIFAAIAAGLVAAWKRIVEFLKRLTVQGRLGLAVIFIVIVLFLIAVL
jgi:hypothetical protein